VPDESLPAKITDASLNGRPAASDVTNITTGTTSFKLSPSAPSLSQRGDDIAKSGNTQSCGPTPSPSPTQSCLDILGPDAVKKGWTIDVTVRSSRPPPKGVCEKSSFNFTSPTPLPVSSECVDETPTATPTPLPTPSDIYYEWDCTQVEPGTEPSDDESCKVCEAPPAGGEGAAGGISPPPPTQF